MTNLLKKALFSLAILFAQTAYAQSDAAGLEAMQLEDWDRAISVYSGLVKADPTNQSAFLSLGNAYLAKGDKEKASANFKAAFDAKSDAPMAYVANGRILLLKNNSAEADKQFNKAKKYARKDMTTWRQIGESYFYYKEPGGKKPNLTRAEAYLKEALEVSTKDYALQMSLGACYREMSSGGPAAQHYEYAEVLNPNSPLPKLMLAKVYRIAKVPEKPMLFYNKAIATSPSYSPALRGKAEYLYFVQYKYDDAAKAYKELVEKGSEVKIEDEIQLANCYYKIKDCKSCSELVEKILQKDPSKNYLRRILAYCDYENGNFASGLNTLNDYFKIITPEKTLTSDYEYHAKLLLQTKGDTTQAINDYKKVIAMDSSKWAINEDIDKLEWARKNYCGALSMYKTYLDSVTTPKATQWHTLGMRHYFCKEDPMHYNHAEMAFAKVTELSPVASIGWLWAAKSAAYQDPPQDSIALHPELANQYGKARSYYEKYAELAEVDKEKNKKDLLKEQELPGVIPVSTVDKEKNKKDLLKAYNYLAYCYFVKVEAEKFNQVMDKWQALETEAVQVQTITEMRAAFGKEPAPTEAGGKN